MTHLPIKSVEERVEEFDERFKSGMPPMKIHNNGIHEHPEIRDFLRTAITADRASLISVIEEWGEKREQPEDPKNWEDHLIKVGYNLALQDLLTFLKTLK